MGIADRCLEVFKLAAEDFLDFRADDWVLGADLAAKAQERATEHATALGMGRRLAIDHVIKVIAEAVEGRDLRGEHLIHTGAFRLPIGLEASVARADFDSKK